MGTIREYSRCALIQGLKQHCVKSVSQTLSGSAAKNLIHAFITSSLDYCTGVLTGAPSKALATLQHGQNLATSPAPSHGRTSPPTLIHHHFVSVKSLNTFGLLLVTHNAPSGPILESTDLGLFCILNTSLGTSGELSFQGGHPHPVELLTIKGQPSISGGLSA